MRNRVHIQDLKQFSGLACCSQVFLALKLKLASACAVDKSKCLDLRRCILFEKSSCMGTTRLLTILLHTWSSARNRRMIGGQYGLRQEASILALTEKYESVMLYCKLHLLMQNAIIKFIYYSTTVKGLYSGGIVVFQSCYVCCIITTRMNHLMRLNNLLSLVQFYGNCV